MNCLLLSAAFIPAIVFNACYGLPQRNVGSLGKRRHPLLFLVVVGLLFDERQRGPSVVHGQRREPVEQQHPGFGPVRALRPASADRSVRGTRRGAVFFGIHAPERRLQNAGLPAVSSSGLFRDGCTRLQTPSGCRDE